MKKAILWGFVFSVVVGNAWNATDSLGGQPGGAVRGDAACLVLANLLPRPRDVKPLAEGYALSPETKITVVGPDVSRCRFIGARLAELIEDEFGLRLPVVAQGVANNWQLFVGDNAGRPAQPDQSASGKENDNPERYRLRVDASGIRASAESDRGLLWAAMTARQLLVKCGEETVAVGARIEDWPRYRWRGFMIDSGRSPNSLPQIKRILRICSAFKLNFVVFREGDDELAAVRYETNKLGHDNPRALGMQEVKELIDYGARLGIAVVPEIESLGHSAAKGRAYPGLTEGGGTTPYPGIGGHIRKAHLNPDDPRTLALLESIYSEWFPLLEDSLVHLGLDEVRLATEPQARHMARLLPLAERVARRSGSKITPMVWADAPPTPAAYRDSVIRVLWSYDGQHEVGLENQHLNRQQIKELAAPDCRQKVIMAGGSNSLHTPYAKSTYEGAFRNLAEWARFGNARENFIGLLVVQWSSNMLDLWVPDFVAGAEFGWNPPDEMPIFAAQMARVWTNLARLDDAARPAADEVDRPAWDGIWLEEGTWNWKQDIVPPAVGKSGA